MGDIHLLQCLIYLDDVIVFSKTFDEHLDRLRAILQRLRENGLKSKPSKCQFLQTSVKYLGHVISEEGITTDPEKIETLKTWPVPQNVDDVRRFLGFSGYYCRFVPNYAKIAKPLTGLLAGHSGRGRKGKSDKLWNWGEEQQSAFSEIISKLVSAPVLAFADFTRPFELHIDASGDGLGAILYQTQEGQKRVIAYASRGLSKSERNYPAHKLEFLALKWAVTKKFHDYLYGNRFTVWTDNNPLTYVLTSAKLDACGHRWLADLAAYDFSIEYIPGTRNRDADALSRLPREVIDVPSVSAICHLQHATNIIETLSVNHDVMDHVISVDVDGTSVGTDQQMLSHQQADSSISSIVELLRDNQRPSKESLKSFDKETANILRQWDSLCLQNNLLCRRQVDGENPYYQLIVPKQQRETIITHLHDGMGRSSHSSTGPTSTVTTATNSGSSSVTPETVTSTPTSAKNIEVDLADGTVVFMSF